MENESRVSSNHINEVNKVFVRSVCSVLLYEFWRSFRNLMIDLVIAMTPYIDGKNIKLLYDLALPWLQV